MMDLEDRLRGTFTGMADEVAPSANPRAELERRLSARRTDRWRMPALVAAAAVVVAAVVTPVIVFQDDGQVGAADQTATSTTEPGTSDGSDPPVPPGAFPIGTFTKDGKDWQAIVYREGNTVCVQAVAADESGQPGCREVAPWPVPPAIGHTQTMSVLSEGLPDSGPLPHLLVFVTSPDVVELTVRNGPGDPVAVEKLGVTDVGTLWLADFAGSSQGYGWDAKDATGKYIDGGIT